MNDNYFVVRVVILSELSFNGLGSSDTGYI